MQTLGTKGNKLNIQCLYTQQKYSLKFLHSDRDSDFHDKPPTKTHMKKHKDPQTAKDFEAWVNKLLANAKKYRNTPLTGVYFHTLNDPRAQDIDY